MDTTRAEDGTLPDEVELADHASGEVTRFPASTGQILILDFFAYWCLPCLPASRDLEAHVRRHYAARGGSARGIPVEVSAINVESAHPEKTREFIARAGISRAFDDPGGRLLARLGGDGLPFIVILHGQRSSTGQFEWRIVYRSAGHEGAARIREIVDSLGPGLPVATGSGSAGAGAQPGGHERGNANGRLVEGSVEFLNTTDTHLSAVRISGREVHRDWELQLAATFQGYDLSYQPDIAIPGLYDSTELREQYWGGQLAAQGRFATAWRWLVDAGFYDGFADYKSVWLEEYYRQSFSALPGYEESDPRGMNISGGMRWDYQPALGFVQAELAYQQDDVSPSYDKPLFEPLIRGLDNVETWSVRISSEQVVSRRLRMRNELQIVDATERDLRFSFQNQLNYAAGEHWTLKSVLGGTWEPPDFTAYFADASVEYDWNDRWFLRLFAHGYGDDGLIRDPLIISSAQPALQTLMLGLGLRWSGERIAVDLAAGPYWTRYDSLPPNSGDFANLYQDRDWWMVKTAIAYRF